LIAAPDSSGVITVWDVFSGHRKRELHGHDGEVRAVDFDLSGRLLLSVGGHDNLILWDLETGATQFTVGGVPSHEVKFGPSGELFVTVGEYRGTRLWRVDRITERIGEGEVVRAQSDVPFMWMYDLDSRHRSVMCAAFNAAGTLLVTGGKDGAVQLWDVADGQLIGSYEEHTAAVLSVAFTANDTFASAGADKTIKLWNQTGRMIRTLEGHTEEVYGLSFSADTRLLASASRAGSVWLWDPSTGQPVATIEMGPPVPSAKAQQPRSGDRKSRSRDEWEFGDEWWRFGNKGEFSEFVSRGMPSLEASGQLGLAFHPSLPLLACVTRGSSGDDFFVDVFSFEMDALLGQSRPTSITYTSAKVVLVGDSGVGKTGLGWRLAHGEFIEHASTHGQQFWLLDDLGTVRSDGTQCEAVLWDLAGQPDYRLIHALFLEDADIALLVFDPTRDDDPLHGVDYWLRQLGIGATARTATDLLSCEAILVAGRADRGVSRLTGEEIDGFCERSGFRAFVVTSALTGEGLDRLLAEMLDAIHWDERPTTVTTETFKQIKDYVLGLKEDARNRQIIMSAHELRKRLEHDDIAGGFSDDEMLSAVGHLSNHGYVTRLRTSKGATLVLLAPELLNNVAASIVLEARRNEKGLGSLEEQRLLSGDYPLRELGELSTAEGEILLDAAVAMFLRRNVCFRETDPLSSRVYLVFPELINLKKPIDSDTLTVEDGVAYTVVGSVENLYASLVVLLGYTSTFTRTNQWRHHARYIVGDALVCGFRLEAVREGELDFVLYFGTTVGTPIRTLFQSLFESFLARRNLTIRRYEPVTCLNGHIINRAVVRQQASKGFGFCPDCGARTSLPSTETPIALTTGQVAELTEQRREVAQRSRFEQSLFRLNAYVTQEQIRAPTCFVSYAWGDRDQERWVWRLANDLVKAGIGVVFDRWENARIGLSVSRFIERIESSDRVIVVGTLRYGLKYENGEPMRGFVAAAEGDLIGARLIGTEKMKQTVLPVLFEGTPEQSFPPLLRGRVYADFRDPDQYFERFLSVVLSLYEISRKESIVRELELLFGDTIG
jgi:GTPase SAR1 family protein